jgi:hypothetical protein
MKHAKIWLGLFALVCIGALALTWQQSSGKTATASNETRTGHAVPSSWLRASQQALPNTLAGVYIGMDVTQLKSVRVRAAPNQKSVDDPAYIVYGESLPNRSRAMYFFDKRSLALAKVQVAEQLPGIEAIQERINTNATRYGAATGVWDCPNQAGSHLATRRLSWTRDPVGVEDVYLVVGQTALATLYVAPSQLITAELKAARCVTTPEGRLTFFPVPTPGSTHP